ncbi:MAG: hypothetical protein AAFU57_13145 [Bacteroidota bacterium]
MRKPIFFLSIFLCLVACQADTDLPSLVLNPTEVTLVFPENNSICTEGTVLSDTESEVTFEWSEAVTGDSYLVRLTDLNTGTTENIQSDAIQMPIVLKRGNPYTWRVVTLMNASGNSAESETGSFYNAGPGVDHYVPFPATILSPEMAETFPSNTTTVDLSWSGADLDNDIVNYDVYFGTVSPPELFLENLVENRLNNITVQSGNTYYWRILTRDAQGNASKTVIYTFEVE